MKRKFVLVMSTMLAGLMMFGCSSQEEADHANEAASEHQHLEKETAGKQQTTVQPIDGISCDSSEGSKMHIHQHLTIVNNGQIMPVPANIGIHQQEQCLFWVHTHTPNGQIHIESPEERTFTLGNFFDIWGQPLSKTQVAEYTEGQPIKAYVDGKPYEGDPREIELGWHTKIVLEVGPKFIMPPNEFEFPAGE